jgi:limonene-1,2-epoxide hydrolase
MSTAPKEIVENFIAAFIDAWPKGDAGTLGSFFSEDAIYHNMPMDPVTGREAIQATFAAFMEMGGQVGVDMINMVADGPIVMTERVDHFYGADTTIHLPLMGIIEVHDGEITTWRDYFDPNQLSSGAPNGG